MTRISSLSERPGHHGPRRLVHWINPAGERKVHSLVDKVYKRKNLEVAWEKVKRNRGAGGVDGEDLAAFEASLDANLDRLHRELRDGKYVPQPVLQRLIPKAGQPGKFRPLGIPTIYDRVCQQALLNRLGPIFEPVFDDANYGYRQGRSTHGALRKIWRELDEGYEWVVDADLADFFGSVDHEKLLELVNQRVSDGRVLGLLRQMLRAGVVAELLLPIWDRLPQENLRVRRLTADDGEQLIGRTLRAGEVRNFRAAFGLDGGPALSGEELHDEIMMRGASIQLVNGWRICRRRLMSAERIEIEGPNDSDLSALKRAGCVTEIITWRTRVFAPNTSVLERIIEHWPIASAA